MSPIVALSLISAAAPACAAAVSAGHGDRRPEVARAVDAHDVVQGGRRCRLRPRGHAAVEEPRGTLRRRGGLATGSRQGAQTCGGNECHHEQRPEKQAVHPVTLTTRAPPRSSTSPIAPRRGSVPPVGLSGGRVRPLRRCPRAPTAQNWVGGLATWISSRAASPPSAPNAWRSSTRSRRAGVEPYPYRFDRTHTLAELARHARPARARVRDRRCGCGWRGASCSCGARAS